MTVDPSFAIAPVGHRLFGSFVEHMGRCVYTGIYEPDHPTADEAGFRGDVLDLVRELGVTVVRYPGGNFVSGYRWEDGVGPVGERPRRLDLAWRSTESNEVGLNEFAGWARSAGVEPMLAVNLGSRGMQEACDLLEYANHPGGSALSDLRAAHGVKEPHDISLWCLGNEMDARWQVGHRSADEYGRIAAQTAMAMRRVDPRVQLVACGSSNSVMPTFGSWERTVLGHTYDWVDSVSLHGYYQQVDDDLDSFLASSVDLDRAIDAIVATCDHVAATRRSRRRLMLSVDEWNVWYEHRFAGSDTLEWAEVPELIEDVYDIADAVVVGSLLITLLRHADRVAVACQAQLVNVIAPILTRPGGPAWRQTIFHPFAQAARWARGTVLRVEPVSPQVDTAVYGEVPLLSATATYDEETGDLTVFAVNRGQDLPLALEVDLRALPALSRDGHPVEHWVLAGDDIRVTNTAEHPDRVRPRTSPDAGVRDGALVAELPPVSWNCLRLVGAPR